MSLSLNKWRGPDERFMPNVEVAAATLPPAGASGTTLESDGAAWQVVAKELLPAGTAAGDTLEYDGANWAVNSEVALGSNSVASGAGAVAIGDDTLATQIDAVAIGRGVPSKWDYTIGTSAGQVYSYKELDATGLARTQTFDGMGNAKTVHFDAVFTCQDNTAALSRVITFKDGIVVWSAVGVASILQAPTKVTVDQGVVPGGDYICDFAIAGGELEAQWTANAIAANPTNVSLQVKFTGFFGYV